MRGPSEPLEQPEAGVLMLKPGVVVAPSGEAELARRVTDAGYAIVGKRMVTPDEVRERKLIRRHYHDHWAVATNGRLLPNERAALAARLGPDIARLPVLPAVVAAENFGVDLTAIARWAEQAATRYGIDSGHHLACNEVGELADVQLLVDAAEIGGRAGAVAPPLLVLNPQIESLATWAEADDPSWVFLLRAASERPAPWETMRRQFLGVGLPHRWPEGSLRGDMLSGRSALRYRAGLQMGAARNGAHLSNGPVEALREVSVWFDVEPSETVVGGIFVRAGVDLVALLEAVYVDDGAGATPLTSYTEHLDPIAAARRTAHAELLRADLTPIRKGA